MSLSESMSLRDKLVENERAASDRAWTTLWFASFVDAKRSPYAG